MLIVQPVVKNLIKILAYFCCNIHKKMLKSNHINIYSYIGIECNEVGQNNRKEVEYGKSRLQTHRRNSRPLWLR